MRINLTAILLFTYTSIALGQSVVTIDGFSKLYCVKIITKDTSQLENNGYWVVGKNQNLPSMAFNVKDPNMEPDKYPNVKNIPYNKQHLVLFDDFNFDGIKDIALFCPKEEFTNEPAYTVFLISKNGEMDGGHNSFSGTIKKGMTYKLNRQEKKLEVFNKKGYDNATVEEYLVKSFDYAPHTKTCIYNSSTNNIYTVMEKFWTVEGNLLKTKTEKKFILNKGSRIILTFKIAQKDKRVIVYATTDGSLHYAFTNKENVVELAYPEANATTTDTTATTDFEYKNGQLSFHHVNADYIIFDGDGMLEVKGTLNGQDYLFTGDPKSKKGALNDIEKFHFKNVSYK